MIESLLFMGAGAAADEKKPEPVNQCSGAGPGRSLTFLLEPEPEPVKRLWLRAVAVWLRGTVVAT